MLYPIKFTPTKIYFPMEIQKQNYIWHTRFFLILFYSVGIAGFSLPLTHDLFQQLVPLNLLVSALLLFAYHTPWKMKHVGVMFAIAAAGFFAEMVGTRTGLIFGNYSYGEALGLKLFSTPLLIGLNWLLLVYSVFGLFPGLHQHRIFPLIGASVLVIFDVVMEPVAIATNMWSWEGGPVPLQNYVAWFVIASVMIFVLQRSRIAGKNPISAWLFSIQFIFFLILNFILT